jgi:hypothetical protein
MSWSAPSHEYVQRVAVLRYNKTGELKLDSAALSEFQHIVGSPGKFCSPRSRSERKKSGSTTAFTVVAMEKNIRSALRNILRVWSSAASPVDRTPPQLDLEK